MTNIRNEIWSITRDPENSKRIIREYFEQLYISKFNNLGEMNQLLGEKRKVPWLTQY